MTDTLSPEERSARMRLIKSKDTTAELVVRKMLRQLSYVGYRIHRKDLPGKPDIVFISKRKAIFIHGCFWHAHGCRNGKRKPKSNTGYWLPKIEKNRQRDIINLIELEALGWSVITVWECELDSAEAVLHKLSDFMRS